MSNEPVRSPRNALPQQKTPCAEVLAELAAARAADARWHDGRTFSLVYHAGDEHSEFLKEAHGLYFAENALNAGAFPSLRRFESEVISMAASFLGGTANTVGTMTSGGTESCMMAVKTYRDLARTERSDLRDPEVVLPITAHPAFDKAADYFGVKIIHTPLGPDLRADVAAMAAAITPKTILLVGSAPAYPHGIVDPIEAIAALGRQHGLPVHVDACLGGFLLPWVRKLGYEVPAFDLSVPGVTSISADLHKYGFAPKGTSLLLYADRAIRRHQFFIRTDWPGGLMGSPSMCGTRPGGPIAAAWAAMRALGIEGYLELARGIMDTTHKLLSGIAAIPSLRILGKPDMSVFAFASTAHDIYAIADSLQESGWFIDRQQLPPSIHVMVTPAHAAVADRFLEDLRDAVAKIAANPGAAASGSAAMYGMLARIPDPSMVRAFVTEYLDHLYD